MKFLLLVAAVLLTWSALRALRGTATPRRGERKKPVAENMVPCHRCGLHVPEKEAVARNGKRYCSEEHAREEPQ